LQRGLEALRCFRPGDEILSATELARRLVLPVPTALRLLVTLESAGFLRRLAESDSFSLHDECQFLGEAFLSTSALTRKARPIVQTFADRFNVHALLCLPERLGMLVLLYLPGSALKPMQLGPGFILPVGNTAFGHAWLWRQAPTIQGMWVSRLRQEEANGSSPQIAKVYQSFHDLEDAGICTTWNECHEGISMMATPLDLSDGSAGAVGCLAVDTRWVASPSHVELSVGLREAAESIHDVLRQVQS
jgi:DNA-binding IclR family transcriptional regulator